MKKAVIIASTMLAMPAFAGYQTGAIPTSIDEVLAITATVSGEKNCDAQIDFDNYKLSCIQRSYAEKDIFVEGYVFVSKDGFSDKNAILDRYLDFDRWPSYVEASPEKAIVDFPTSETISDETLANGDRKIVHYFRYSSETPIFLPDQKIAGSSTYTVSADPTVAGAVLSASFQTTRTWGEPWELVTPVADLGNEAIGMKGQDANIHIVDLADEELFLLVYRTRVRPTITLLPDVSSKYIVNALKDILTGMFPVE